MSEEETLLEFPCRFPIKAMGKNNGNFESLIIEIVRRHVNNLSTQDIKTRLSKGDKFLSVTVTIEATSKKQLDAIYQGLTDCPEVLMAL